MFGSGISMYISNFEDLRVWKYSHQLVIRIYTSGDINFPNEEKYGLESQLKRAAVSIPANIAEGCKRKHTKEVLQFLNIALGSLSEARYYLLLCKDLSFLAESNYLEYNELCITIDKMLESLIYKIRNKS